MRTETECPPLFETPELLARESFLQSVEINQNFKRLEAHVHQLRVLTFWIGFFMCLYAGFTFIASVIYWLAAHVTVRVV